jgi:hypothetical protein
MYYYPGGSPNWPGPFPSKEREGPEQPLTPEEDYTEMTEQEARDKTLDILENPSEEHKRKIMKSVLEDNPKQVWQWISNSYGGLWSHVQSMVQDGEL